MSQPTSAHEQPTLLHPARGYADQPMPLAGRAALSAGFATAIAGGALAARRAGLRIPERLDTGDVLAAGVATYKLARIISKDKVTTFARAPFTEYQERAGRGEVEEAPRGGTFRRAVGELLTCPYCLGVWIASGFVGGLVAAPRQTRMVIAAVDVVALSDGLQMLDRAAARTLMD
ncbi:MAG TPA: DUF1360 domain-containing protein [Gaiellales bacterium]|jgi:hypothetical protein